MYIPTEDLPQFIIIILSLILISLIYFLDDKRRQEIRQSWLFKAAAVILSGLAFGIVAGSPSLIENIMTDGIPFIMGASFWIMAFWLRRGFNRKQTLAILGACAAGAGYYLAGHQYAKSVSFVTGIGIQYSIIQLLLFVAHWIKYSQALETFRKTRLYRFLMTEIKF